MAKRIIFFSLLAGLLFSFGGAEAAPQVIQAAGVYIMGDNDSPKIAKDAARQEAMRSAVEQAGVYVESYSRTQNMQLTEDDVRMISGAVLKVTHENAVPELTGNVMKYTVNITAEVDTDTIDLQNMMQKRQELEKLQKERDELKKQNEELLQKYEHASGKEKQRIGHQLENQYTLGQIFDECVALIQRGEHNAAITRLNMVIRDTSVTDSPLAYAYYLRGRAYYGLRSDDNAMLDFDSAQNTPHDDAIYPIWKCHRYRGLIYYDRQRYQEAYNELRWAWEASPKDDRELWNELRRADEMAHKRQEPPPPPPQQQPPAQSGDSMEDMWKQVIGNILIDAIKGEIGNAQGGRHKVYRGTPRKRIPV